MITLPEASNTLAGKKQEDSRQKDGVKGPVYPLIKILT